MGEYRGYFICPECGSKRTPDEEVHVSPIENDDDPATHVLQWIKCAQCGVFIPAHIAERWDDLSIDDAKKDWLEYYRNKFDI